MLYNQLHPNLQTSTSMPNFMQQRTSYATFSQLINKVTECLSLLTLRLIMSYIYIYIYIYIYDISSLMVNVLTLILLTWRKW